jgi:hypothetical protein
MSWIGRTISKESEQWLTSCSEAESAVDRVHLRHLRLS